MVLAFPSVLTMVFPWPGYILYPLYAHNPILKHRYWKYKYDLINSQKMLWKKSDIHTTLHTKTYFILSTGYQHGSDRSRMRGTNTLLYVHLWNYAPYISSTIFVQYSCRGRRASACKWKIVCQFSASQPVTQYATILIILLKLVILAVNATQFYIYYTV